MASPPEIAKIILRDYATIAHLAAEQGRDWWRNQVCGPIFEPIKEAYPLQPGYIEAADLGLGCAFPVALSDIKTGDRVADLGCAAGVDSFIAAHKVGPNGQVFGFDLTPELIAAANEITVDQKLTNIQFEVSDIADLPLEAASMDAMISNGVFSLLPDLQAVFQEMFRVLAPGGHFLIADLTCNASIPPALHARLCTFTGCINGISHFQTYLDAAKFAGFEALELRSERIVLVPDELLAGIENPLVAVGIFGRKPMK